MEVMIKHLKPTDVKGLSFWFWYRDGVATVTDLYVSTVWQRQNNFNEYILAFVATLMAPIMYLFMPFVTALLAERNILKRMANQKGQSQLLVYSKQAIEYFTLLSNLRRPQ